MAICILYQCAVGHRGSDDRPEGTAADAIGSAEDPLRCTRFSHRGFGKRTTALCHRCRDKWQRYDQHGLAPVWEYHTFARLCGDRAVQSTVWAGAAIGSASLSRSHFHIQCTYPGIELFCQVRHPVPDPHLPANAPSGNPFASRSNPGYSSLGYDGNFAYSGKACRSYWASTGCDSRSAYLCGYDCLAHDAHLVDTNLEDRGDVAAVGVCFGASSADPGIGNVTHQERRAQRSSEWLDSDSGIAVYCGSTRRGCFFKHCAGTQSAVRHPPGGAGDNGRVITTTKYLVGYA